MKEAWKEIPNQVYVRVDSVDHVTGTLRRFPYEIEMTVLQCSEFYRYVVKMGPHIVSVSSGCGYGIDPSAQRLSDTLDKVISLELRPT